MLRIGTSADISSKASADKFRRSPAILVSVCQIIRDFQVPDLRFETGRAGAEISEGIKNLKKISKSRFYFEISGETEAFLRKISDLDHFRDRESRFFMKRKCLMLRLLNEKSNNYCEKCPEKLIS